MTDYIWLVGGSLMSAPMAQEIKRRGYKLLLTDKNKDSICRQYADIFILASVYDEEANLSLAKMAKASDHKIVAVLCIGCDAGPTVSLLSDYFDLPSVGYEVARQTKDKAAVREALALDHPHFVRLDEMSASFEPQAYPVVVKPVAESGSRGFQIVTNNDELREAVGLVDRPVIVEELLIGQDVIPEWREQYGFETSEIALDFFVQDGKVHYANGALRLFWADMPGIEAGHINPYVPSPEIVEKAQYAAEKLGVTWGPFKCDFLNDERYGWTVMECATRLSGGFDHGFTCPLAIGKDITGAMLDIALGKSFKPEMVKAKYSSYVCAFAPRFKPGSIYGWQAPKFDEGYTFYLASDRVKRLISNQDRPLFVIRRGNTMDEALEAAMKDAERIKPNYV